MKFIIEYIIYCIVRLTGIVIRRLPVGFSLAIGRFIGVMAYYFDFKHKSLAYSNLKLAFAKSKSPRELKKITKDLFMNYGQNLIELFRLPLMNKKVFDQYVTVEGGEHVASALEQEKGVILLAMHFGSWELGSLASAMMGRPYKVIVKPQKRHTRLDNLLNSYRECGGSVVIERGMGTREMVKSLRNNEIVGMVVDQGGRDGTLVPFFDRQASMSVGAIRMGLKFGVPVCFAIIVREGGAKHRLIIHKPLQLQNTGDVESDVSANLKKVTSIMETYIEKYPAEYMWFYKIWKYSKESTALILHDGRVGHLRQSQAVARQLLTALSERDIQTKLETVEVRFKNKWAARLMAIFSVFANNYIYQGRIGFMKWFLSQDTYESLMKLKADFIISCGSSTTAVNYLFANDQQAKNIVILKPGFLDMNRFDLVVLPQHDWPGPEIHPKVLITRAAPNLITPQYIQEQTTALLSRFSHLKTRANYTIGLLIGGDTKSYPMSEAAMRTVLQQIKIVAEELKADVLISTSRRTPQRIESMVYKIFKKHPRCPLLISASRSNIPEAVGGILGLADQVVVSGDSISMISEAASSGKPTVVFPVYSSQEAGSAISNKHKQFIELLNQQGYLLATDVINIRQTIYNLTKNKIQTKALNDNQAILETVRKII